MNDPAKFPPSAEGQRLAEDTARKKNWKRWGPYLSERGWGTVREDYSAQGSFWEYFPHDHARSKAYRWGEDGLGGICDRQQYICFALALWNGQDPILKERLFGLTGNEGNHAEDVKEYYFYLDSTPTHSYMKYLYKYPHAEFPYTRLRQENGRRGRQELEFELLDTGIFEENRYFDVFIEYAKAAPEDILVRIEVVNRGPEPAPLQVLPTVWFRNTWSWGLDARPPQLRQEPNSSKTSIIALKHYYYEQRWLYCEGAPEILFTDNETNPERVPRNDWSDLSAPSGYFKDGINDYIVNGDMEAVNPARIGTKASAHYPLLLGPGKHITMRLRLTNNALTSTCQPFDAGFDRIFAERQQEADEFYTALIPPDLSADGRNIMRQAFAGLLWSKQFYHYDVSRWLRGDPTSPPPRERLQGRNHEWTHLYNADVISMPDKWEYPWYAAWDLAFHCVPLALVDPQAEGELRQAILGREVEASS